MLRSSSVKPSFGVPKTDQGPVETVQESVETVQGSVETGQGSVESVIKAEPVNDLPEMTASPDDRMQMVVKLPPEVSLLIIYYLSGKPSYNFLP